MKNPQSIFLLSMYWSRTRANWLKRAADGGSRGCPVSRCFALAADAEDRVIALADEAMQQAAAGVPA